MRFALSREALALLAESPSALRVRIFRVVSDALGDQEGEDKTFHLDGTPEGAVSYRLEGLKLGLKEFQLEILNADGEVIGDGKARHVVKPGAQQLGEAINITLREPTRRRRDVPLAFHVTMAVPGEGVKTTYLDVKAIMKSHCLNCHAEDSMPEPGGGLVLSSYPFVSRTFVTQPEIVADMLRWMRAFDYPMPPPPSPRVAEDKLAVLDQWITDGLLAAPQGADDIGDVANWLDVRWKLVGGEGSGTFRVARSEDPARPFVANWPQVAVSARYDLEIDVCARDGTVVTTKVFAGTRITEDGELEMTVDVPYAAPVVDIPVIVVVPTP